MNMKDKKKHIFYNETDGAQRKAMQLYFLFFVMAAFHLRDDMNHLKRARVST